MKSEEFLARKYDKVNLSIIEDGIRFEMPKVLSTINKILKENKGHN